jgi:hypothetical protein
VNCGTPETQAKRLALVNDSGDQTLAFTLPDILYAHRVLDADQHAAAIRFRNLREHVFPHPLRNGEPGPMPTEERIAANEAAYDRAARRLTDEQKCPVVDLVLGPAPAGYAGSCSASR